MQDITLTEFCNSLSKFVVSAEGNLSYKTENGFCIKQSGTPIKECIFIECDNDGNPYDQQTRPSIETGFHALIYKNTDYKFIAHTHPINTLKILCSDLVEEFASNRLFPDQVVFNGVYSCVVPYATPGDKLTNEISKIIKLKPRLILLKNHGIICCSYSKREAIAMTEVCEKSAEIMLGAKQFGNPIYLTEKQITEIQNHKGEVYRNDNLR